MDCNTKDVPIQFLLWQILNAQRQKAIQWLENVDMKPGQAGCLFILSKYGTLSQKENAEKLGVKPPSMTVLLRKLEKKNFVIRMQDENDQRISRIYLTEEGKAYIDQIKEMMREMDREMFEGILPEEKMLFRRLLMQIRENLISKEGLQDYEAQMKKECISDWSR